MDIFNGKGVAVTLMDDQSFLKIKETLTRIGIASKKDKTLFQSCHILHKKGAYRILHFKELFELDGKYTNISESDIGRRNTICKLLEDWGLLINDNFNNTELNMLPMNQIKIISFKEKSNWTLVPKYTIGKFSNN